MKKFHIIHTASFLAVYPDHKPVQVANNADMALSIARNVFGQRSVEDVEPVSDRDTDFIDKDELNNFLVNETAISPEVYAILRMHFKL